jgi:hypothetical protein
LDGVHHHQPVRAFAYGSGYGQGVAGGGEVDTGPGRADAGDALTHLIGAFLGRDVQHRCLARHRPGDLGQQGAFAYARFPADEHHRSGRQAATQHPVELGQAGGQTYHRWRLNHIQRFDLHCGRRPALMGAFRRHLRLGG